MKSMDEFGAGRKPIPLPTLAELGLTEKDPAPPAPEAAAEVVKIAISVDAKTRAYLEREYAGASQIPVEITPEVYVYLERLYGPLECFEIDYGGG